MSAEKTHQRCSVRSHGGRRRQGPARGQQRPGRANGERLCSLRGRLTPRGTGSSAQPLPGQAQAWDSAPACAPRQDDRYGKKNPTGLLTHKEDSIGAAERQPDNPTLAVVAAFEKALTPVREKWGSPPLTRVLVLGAVPGGRPIANCYRPCLARRGNRLDVPAGP